jgi:uncharacterized protein
VAVGDGMAASRPNVSRVSPGLDHAALEDVFLIPHADKYLLHAPLHGVTCLMSAATAVELRRLLAGGDRRGVSPRAMRLAEDLSQRTATVVPVQTGPFAPLQVSLLPTNDCNMRCLYCAPEAGSNDLSTMSEETCEVALRYQADVVRREDYRCLMVYYFGGEPFVAWRLVTFADTTARRLADEIGRPMWSACTTNGFMSATHASWVARHLTFVLVSIDGPAKLHDLYRPSRGGGATHQTVVRTLRIFEDEGLPYALRCSVDNRIVERLPEVVDYLCRQFHPVKINLEPLIMHGRCLETGLVSPTPSAFVNGIVAAGKVARDHGVSLKLTTAQTERMAQSNCAVAEDNFVVAPDGLVSACFGANSRSSPNAQEYAIGEVDVAAGTVRIDQARVDKVRGFAVANIPRCHGCFCKWHCSGGCRLFHTPPFSIDEPGPMCVVTQKLTLWRILQQLQLFDEADRVRLEPEEAIDAFA